MAVFTTRPVVMGRRGVVTAGHYLAAAAGFRMMEQGGNAIDAAASMSICLQSYRAHSVRDRWGGADADLFGVREEDLCPERSGLGPGSVLHRLVVARTASTSSQVMGTCL